MTLASVSSSNYLERLRPLSLIQHSMRRVQSSYAPSNSRGLSNGYLRRNVKAAEQTASADRLRRPLSAALGRRFLCHEPPGRPRETGPLGVGRLHSCGRLLRASPCSEGVLRPWRNAAVLRLHTVLAGHAARALCPSDLGRG